MSLSKFFKLQKVGTKTSWLFENKELVRLEYPLVLPQASSSSPARVRGGLVEDFDEDFVYQWRGQRINANTVTMQSATDTSLSNHLVSKMKAARGHYYYGGPVFHHFGHFLAESIHRLMFLKDVTTHHKVKKVIFLPQRYITVGILKKGVLPPQFYEVLSYLGVSSSQILIQTKPTKYEYCWVSKQQSYFRSPYKISNEYKNFLAQCEANHDLIEVINSPSKIYVSRTNYSYRGTFAGEKYIESILEKNGFTIVYPEKLSLIEQLKLYKNASQIIFSEGTALHVLELLAEISAQIGVIRRRKHGLESFQMVLNSRCPNWSYIEPAIDFPSLFVPKRSEKSASGSATSIHCSVSLELYLKNKFAIRYFDSSFYKSESLKDLDNYREYYKGQLEKTAFGKEIMEQFDLVQKRTLQTGLI